MTKFMRRTGCLFCLMIFLFPLFACAEATDAPQEAPSDSLASLYLSRSAGSDYAAYAAAHSDAPLYAGDALTLYESRDELPEGASAAFTIDVPEDCFAYPEILYAMTGDNILDNLYSLTVDGEAPYRECEALSLDTVWTQTGNFALDRYGNEVVGMPVKSREKTSCRLMGKAALYSKGMGLYLTKGKHDITLACKEGAFTLYAFTLHGETVPAQTEGAKASSVLIEMRAECAPARNNPNIRPASDYNISLSPYSSDKKVVNYIEDLSYRYAGDTLTYRFTVPETGYYALALRMRQAELENFPVYRTFYLDGSVPAPAFDNAAFGYSLHFINAPVRNADGSEALVYLTAGEHELTVQTSLDPVRPAIQMLTLISDEIAALALDLTKITGGNTDFFRDFNLADFDFHIADDLARWIEELRVVRDELTALAGGGRVGLLGNLEVALNILEQLAREPDDLPKKLNQFSRGNSSARAMLVKLNEELMTSPMGLDSVFLYTDAALLPGDASLGEQLASSASRFAASFGDQGYTAGVSGGENRVQVWVNRSRQYLEIMQRMADATFTPQTGIAVDFSIMPDESKLILANASGSAPDVALGVSSGRTYDLAVRGALKNLREYDDYARVASWFPTGLLIPGVCDDGLYALPETFNFYVLFYRKDILSSIGLTVPDSYEDVLAMLPALHRYGLNYNNFVANAIGYKSFSLTTPYIFQCGGKLYENGNIKCLLDSQQAIDGLQLLTDSFVIYDMDYEIISFYQAFRDGTLPIGTSNYVMYNLLMNAAPELSDRWGIALYPGVTDENGVVQRWTSGAEQSDFIFSTTDMPEESWQFLKWWMSEDVQTEFAYALQSTLGNEYMWNSANTAAFLRAPWQTEHKEIIAEQMTWIYEAPRVPGSYMVEREISNAVNAVALQGKNLRAALDEAIKRIDREVERKLEEFGRLKDGELTTPFLVPDIEMVRGWLQDDR